MSQLVVGGVVCWIWNPIARQHAAGPVPGAHHFVADHLWLLWLNGRDLIDSSFVVLPLVLAPPLLWFKRPNPWLLRGPAAIAVYVAVTSLCVATASADQRTAEVRYLAPVLPFGIGVAVAAVWAARALRPRPRAVLLGVSALTVMVGASPDGHGPVVSCDPLMFARELARPQAEPYTPAIAWVHAHVPPGASVLVSPDWMAYPLMFRAPGPTYAWQLTDPPRADFATVADVHVHGRVPPDYLVEFGSQKPDDGVKLAMAELSRRGVRYEPVATLPFFWRDLYRPERVWRSFTTVTPKIGEAIYIYRRVRKP